MNVLEVEQLEVGYGARLVVRGVSFAVAPGKVFGLLGPNGAGKTTILSTVEGLRAPRSGSIRVCGVDALRQPLVARSCLGVGLQATAFQPDLTLAEILRLFGALYGRRLSKGGIGERLAQVGLAEQAQRKPDELSGGQRQRLVLAVAFVHDPQLVILDEPTAGLDPQSRRDLWRTLLHLRGQGAAIVLTTHSMEEAAAMSDHIAILDHGEIVTAGSPTELVARYATDSHVQSVAHGAVTLEDVFVGLTGRQAEGGHV